MKIAIIGAGISGLYLAWEFSERGYDVTVFEKKERIGNEVCSGLFSQRILEFIPEAIKLIQNEINFVNLRFPKKTITVRFSKNFYVMSHSKLDKLVANLAQKAGAKIILNYNISSIPKGFDKIIGCDGANSFIRQKLNLPDPDFRLAIQGFVNKPYSVHFVEVWPLHKGFIWKIPRGNETEYGIIAPLERAKKNFKDFLEKNNISLERIKAKIVPQGFIIPKNTAITLCGDATGLTKPWSGGGVVWGLTAAEILLKNFPDFLRYRKLLKQFFLPRIAFTKTATKIVYFLGFKLPWLLPKNSRMESDFLL